MGLFKKLISKAAEAAGVDSLAESIMDKIPGSSNIKDAASKIISTSKDEEVVKNTVSPKNYNEDYDDKDLDYEDLDDEDYDDADFDDEVDDDDDDQFDEDFDEDEYDEEPEESDDDLEEFGRQVDEMIADREGDLDNDDRSALAEQAEAYGITREEFEKMLDARIDEINDAINAGYEPREVYRTRSVWRRCPRCGYLNYPNDVYCEWCGYQLRYKAISAVLGALIYMGAKGGNPKKLLSSSVKKTQKKTIKAKKKRVENKAKGIKPKRKASVVKKQGTTSSKNSLFGSKSATKAPEKKKSLFGGSTSSKPEKKKSLFGGGASSKPEKKKSLFGGGSSSSSSSKKSSLLGGGLKKSSGIKLGGGRRRR